MSKLFVPFIACSLALLAFFPACGADPGGVTEPTATIEPTATAGPTATAEPKGNFETCEGFLHASEVEEISGVGGFVARVNRTRNEPSQQPGEADRSRTICGVAIEGPGGLGLGMMVVRFDVPEGAGEAYSDLASVYRRNQLEGEGGKQLKEGVLGPDSLQVMSEGWSARYVSPMVMFREGRYIVQLADNEGGSDEPLITSMEDLISLAHRVQKRLP